MKKIMKKKNTDFYLLKKKSLSEGDLFVTDYLQSKREIEKLKKDLFNMRFKKINGQLQNIAEYSTIKKNIARLYNIIGTKK